MNNDNIRIRKLLPGTLIVIVLLAVWVIISLVLSGTFVVITPEPENQYCLINSSSNVHPLYVPRLLILNRTNDSVQYENFTVLLNGGDSDEYAPPAEECNHYAAIALEPYGGMPEDAVMASLIDASSWGYYNATTSQMKSGVATRRMDYKQMLNGMPVLGKAGWMTVELGGNGSLRMLDKHWLTLKETGLTPLIPQSEAIQRLKEGQIRDAPDLAFNLRIRGMSLGYYTPLNGSEPQYLEPVWIVKATDIIRGKDLELYVPAQNDTSYGGVNPAVLESPDSNFTQIRCNLIPPDVAYPVNVWYGTSGLVGKERALNTIRSFTEKPDITPTYDGRFSEHGGGGCGGSSYFWDYYEFSTSDCNFKVDAFTGTMLSASLSSTCSNAGIGKFKLENVTPTEHMIAQVTNFTRDRYYHFDQRHMKIILNMSDIPIYEFYNNDHYEFTGDMALQSNFGVKLEFQPDDGLLSGYTVTDDRIDYLCYGGGPIKIREE